jgi:hypothetical protein
MIPDAILSRIAKLFLLLSAALVFGIIYGIATHDRILLLLSIALAIAGGVKITVLFLSARKKEYEIVEGTVTSLRRIPVRKCQVLKITNDTGAEAEILVKGRAALKAGKRYRLYLSCEEPITGNLPESDFLRPARALLGFEETLTEQ